PWRMELSLRGEGMIGVLGRLQVYKALIARQMPLYSNNPLPNKPHLASFKNSFSRVGSTSACSSFLSGKADETRARTISPSVRSGSFLIGCGSRPRIVALARMQ